MKPRCPGCKCLARSVPPDGPVPSRILCIGERPGWREDDPFNQPFTGEPGREFNDNYLHLAGLDRNTDIRFTNTVRCRATDAARKPSQKEIDSCAGYYLPAEIRTCEPEIIVLMGGTACGMVEGPKIDLDTEHGIPRYVKGNRFFGDWEGWVVPMYHPAAGTHQTNLMTPLIEDWENFGRWLRGEWRGPKPVAKVKVMKRLTTPEEVSHAVNKRDYCYPHLPLDTESDEDRPFSIQFSPNPEEGYMILSQDKEAMSAFGAHLAFEWGNRLAMHFALHDLTELEQHYGWTGLTAVDTMIDSYHLGNLPQGLKALTYRLTGVRMTSYQDVVIPASRDAVTDWLAEAITYVGSEWTMEKHKQLKTKVSVTKLKHPAESVLRRVFRYISESERSGSDYDPWLKPKKLGTDDEEIRLLGQDWMEPLEHAIGRMPRCSIIHAPLNRAVEYGCSDAIYTGHSLIRLEERRAAQQKKWTIDEDDKDETL